MISVKHRELIKDQAVVDEFDSLIATLRRYLYTTDIDPTSGMQEVVQTIVNNSLQTVGGGLKSLFHYNEDLTFTGTGDTDDTTINEVDPARSIVVPTLIGSQTRHVGIVGFVDTTTVRFVLTEGAADTLANSFWVVEFTPETNPALASFLALADLSDVAISAPVDDQFLRYNSGTGMWENETVNAITQLTGDVTATGPGAVAATIAANAVTNTKLRDSAAVSVIGRSANSTGDPADIAAAANGQYLQRQSDALAFAGVNAGDVNSGLLALARGGTNADLSATGGTSRVLRQSSAGAAVTVSQLASTDISDIASGVYTPTLTNVANLDASTAFQCQYVRVGSVVTVSGKVEVDPTAPATPTQLGISLPVASNIGAAEDCGGVAFASAIAGQGAAILGDAANNRAEMNWIAGDVTNQPMYFTFTYRII